MFNRLKQDLEDDIQLISCITPEQVSEDTTFGYDNGKKFVFPSGTKYKEIENVLRKYLLDIERAKKLRAI
jgi:hypothetical protein